MSTVIIKLFLAIIIGLFYSLLLYLFYQAYLMLKELKNAQKGTDEPNFNKQQLLKGVITYGRRKTHEVIS